MDMYDDELAAMQLTREQAKVIVAIERVGASLSMIGVFLIIITFALFKRLRTVPNTFILFASIANIGASTACLIGLAGIERGSGSALCRAQAFLLEMFMQSDPWWSAAMAFNVYLVFFHAANPTTFRRHLWVYCLICYGLPMIPAIVLLFVDTSTKGPVYGDATLWCWIDDSWNSLRIFSYYIPVWACIFFSAVIYVAVGYHVFHQRNQLRNLSLSNQGKDLSSSENLTRHPEVYGTVTTEVQITSDTNHTPPMTPLGSPMHCPWNDDSFQPAAADNNSSGGIGHHLNIDEELGNIGLSPPQAVHNASGGSSAAAAAVYPATSTTVVSSPSPPHDFPPQAQMQQQQQQQQQLEHSPGPAAYRLHPQSSSSNGSPYQSNNSNSRRASSVAAGAGPPSSPPRRGSRGGRVSAAERMRRSWHRVTSKLRHMDPVKLAYLRTSFVFAISVLVTWTPSSINRVYTLVHPDRISYGLNIASAAVLPLQGVWNAVIYFSTSWNLLREEVARRCARSRWLRRIGARTRLRLGSGSSSGGGGEADRRRIPGIVVDGGGADHDHGRAASVAGRSHSNAGTEMGTVLSPARRSRSGSSAAAAAAAAADVGIASAAAAGGIASPFVHGALGCYDENDTESDSLDGAAGVASLRGSRSRRLRSNASMDFEPMPGSPPRLGTLRIQKGGELDMDS